LILYCYWKHKIYFNSFSRTHDIRDLSTMVDCRRTPPLQYWGPRYLTRKSWRRRVIENGIPTEALIAHVLVAKYAPWGRVFYLYTETRR
jgi:hypothetical protein